METLILVLHVLTGLSIIGLVLLQHGKGADMGAAFGGGASGSLFGATGSANFLSRITAGMATVFFITSLGLTWYSTHNTGDKGVMATQPASQQTPAPATTTTTTTTPVPVPASEPPAADPNSKVKDIPK